MASGYRNKVIGQTGEFAVCVQLGKLGVVATPFAGNVPDYDIIATNESLRSVPIQVKATLGHSTWLAGDATSWMKVEYDPETKTQTVGEPLPLPHPDLLMVYVWLHKDPGGVDRFFITTRSEVQGILREAYKKWLDKIGRVRPKNPESYHLVISPDELAPFENRWDRIIERLG